MSRRVMAIGVMGVALAMLQSADTSANRLYPTPGGWTWYHGSTNCTVTVGELGSAQKAGITCAYTATELRSECLNPQTKETLPGKSYYGPPKKIQKSVLLTADDGGFGKKERKNTASASISFEDLQYYTSAELCPNKRWTLLSVDVISFDFVGTVFACVGTGGDPCSEQAVADETTGHCTRGPDDTFYDCPANLQTHTHYDL